MTYHKIPEDKWHRAICFGCGKPLEGPTIEYLGHHNDMRVGDVLLMHRDCAITVARRILLDAWPNRKEVQ